MLGIRFGPNLPVLRGFAMANAPLSSFRFTGGLLLVKAGTLALAFSLKGQKTAPTSQIGTAAEPQVPAEA